MANDEKWYFTKEQLETTPSKQCGIDLYKELSYRQQAANFIQDMGQRLKVSQLCINTAIVYMHRFYVFHSFSHFPWHSMAAAALFLAAKVEEQPRKLEHVIRIANLCKNSRDTNFDVNSERYQAQLQDLVFNENVLLQTLGFDVAIDHPHTHVVRCCHLVRASKDLAQTSYFMASNSLHLTTMCLQYKPTVVACFCIHLACKWSNWEIPLSNEKKEWFSYVDTTVTSELLEQLTDEFLTIFERSPSRLKEKIMAIGNSSALAHNPTRHPNSPFDTEPKKTVPSLDPKDPYYRQHHIENKQGLPDDPHKHRTRLHDPSSNSREQQREREYREKKERAQQQQHGVKCHAAVPGQSGGKQPGAPSSHSFQRPVLDPKLKQQHSRPPSLGGHHAARGEPKDILREATKDICLKDYREASARDVIKETIKEVSGGGNERDNLVNRDTQQVHARSSDKDASNKRDHLVKSEANSVNNCQDSRFSYGGGDKLDRLRPPDATCKVSAPPKHESARPKPHVKADGGDAKKTTPAGGHAFPNKLANSAAQKLKPPFADPTKSVPNRVGFAKIEPRNGDGGGLSLPPPPVEAKTDVVVKEEVVTAAVKKPSLFSPEKSPPYKKSAVKTSPGRREVQSQLVSPLESGSKRTRTVSNGSEPELRPVMTKIDQVEGFENLMRDSSIGIKLPQVPDIITPIVDGKPEKSHPHPAMSHAVGVVSISQELKPPDIIPPFSSTAAANNVLSQPIVNGIETNPTLISNLLKEAPSVPHLPAVAASSQPAAVAGDAKDKEREHHHKERKKKNKEKHKHKDKDRTREEKEKKKKHKDKEREKHKGKDKCEAEQAAVVAQPIKITIQKDKIQLPAESPGPRVKITIPKDKIKTESLGETSAQAPAGGLKIKIPKEKITNYGGGENRKRERERDRSSLAETPPNKIAKSGYNNNPKQNGRSSYGTKVAHLGDGDSSLQRLAESKYTSKGTSS